MLKVHRMKFTWDSPVFFKKHIQLALFYNITFPSLQSNHGIGKRGSLVEYSVLLFFPVVSQSPANGNLERVLLDDKGFIDLF